MTNPAHQTADTVTVREYLLAAYLLDEVTVREAMLADDARSELETARVFGSHAYYPGNRIATARGWEPNPDFDFDEDDEDDEDEDDEDEDR